MRKLNNKLRFIIALMDHTLGKPKFCIKFISASKSVEGCWTKLIVSQEDPCNLSDTA